MSVFSIKEKKVTPTSLLFSAKPKVGKTTMLSKLRNNLIINTEKNGTSFLDIPVIDCSSTLEATPSEIKDLLVNNPTTKALDLGDITDPVKRMAGLERILKALIVLKKPYPFVSLDTITQCDMDAEWYGTELYMNSNAGKTFNRISQVGVPSSQWKRATYGQEGYESVIEGLGQNGWRWSRTAMVNLLHLSQNASSECTIYVAHVKEKILSRPDKGEVFVKDIALTGAVSDIYSRNVDAVASVYREDDKLMISFKGNEEKTGGNRGQIGDYEGEFDWNKIFDFTPKKPSSIKSTIDKIKKAEVPEVTS